MARLKRQVLLDYAAAVMAVPVMAVLLSIPVIGKVPNTPVMVALLAILVVAWRGGAAPGLVTTSLLALTAIPSPFPASQILRHVLFLGAGTAVSLLVGSLHKARVRAEAASRAKDRFLAALSHELRTPLTPVLASVSALLDEPEAATSPELRATLELIRRGIEIESRLIDDLLDASLAIHGTMRLSPEIVNVHELVGQTLDLCRAEMTGAGLRLELDLAATRTHVEADRSRLLQVLWNLVRNATKFTPAGGCVTIRTRNQPEPGSFLILEVADTGVGIELGAMGRIFEAFEQGDFRSRPGGLGLGLAISRAIVDAQGGRLLAASAGPGLGTILTLEMPTTDPIVPGPEAQAPPSRRSFRILLVEDDPPSLRVMSRLLRQKEHAVTTADSLSSALDLGLAGEFDLVISDIGLPDGTGWDLMRQLRQRGQIQGIAMSGFGQEDDLRKSREAGFLDHITKPVDFPKLEATIQRVATGP